MRWSTRHCGAYLWRSYLTYVDFLEALARITTFKPLPSEALIQNVGATSCANYLENAAAGMYKAPEQKMRRPLSWREEEVTEAPLAEPLKLLLSVIIARLDEDGSGVLSKKELQRLI